MKRVKLFWTSSMLLNMSGCSNSIFVMMARAGFSPRKAPSYSSASITKKGSLPPTAFAPPVRRSKHFVFRAVDEAASFSKHSESSREVGYALDSCFAYYPEIDAQDHRLVR